MGIALPEPGENLQTAEELQAENAALQARVHELEQALAESTEHALYLSQTEQRYAELLRLSPYGVLIQEDGRIVYVNDRGLQILGASQPGEIVGRQPKEFVAPEATPLFWERDATLRQSGAASPQRYQIVRLSGERVEVEVASVLLNRGVSLGVMTVFEDVSARIAAEAAAQEFAQRYQFINELGSDYIYLDRIEPDGRPVPLWVTDAFTRITGYGFDDLLEEDLLARLVYPEDLPVVQQHLAQLFANQPHEATLRMICKDGAVRWVRHIARPIYDAAQGRVTLLYGSVRDVHETVEARHQLHRSEQALKEAQRIAQVGSWMVELGTYSLEWSDECYRIFGRDPADFTPTNEAFFAAVHPEDLPRVLAASQAAQATGEIYEIEHRIIRPDGSVRHVHERAEMLRGADSRTERMLGTVLDITERVRAEQELKAAYEALQQTHSLLEEEVADRRRIEAEAREFADRYQMISELSEEFIGLSKVTPEGGLEFLWLTDSFERMTGFTLADTRAPDFLERLSTPESLDIQLGHIGAALRNEFTTVEGQLRTKDGRVRWIRSTLRPLWSEAEGRVTHIYGCVRDITPQHDALDELKRTYATLEETNQQLEEEASERQQAQQSLRTSEGRYRELVESMGEGLLLTDFDERIIYANPTAERIFGVAPSGLAGRTLQEFVDEATYIKIRNESGRRLRGEHSVYELEIQRRDGDRRRLRASASPLRDAAGNVTATMGVFADVTEQEQLRNRLNDEQREESIVMLAGGIAHDFNNMLMGVQGAAALLESTLSADDEVTHELTQAIMTSARRMADLTNKLLAYARGGKYQTRIVNLNEAVRNASLMLRGNVPSRVSVELDLADALWPVEADAGQIEQVLLNLCVNAFEAIEAGAESGIVRISTANEQTAQLRPRPPRVPQSALCVRVSVVDTGGGMSPETLERVFEPFFSTKFHGRGLGLAASSGIVRNHGGVIWAESTPGQGTAFHMLIPAAHRPPEGDELDVLAAVPEDARVLVVDDDVAALDITRRMLENLGFSVIVATTGTDGLASFRKYGPTFSLLIVDMQMPDMSGAELMRQVRQLDPAARVLICSGYSAEDALYELGSMPIEGFLAKPFSLHELAQALAAALVPASPAAEA